MPKDTFFNLKQEKQEKILRSAISEFNAHGFIKANIGIIAKNAEVSKGSMYQYFQHKEELFVYCVKWSIEYLLNMVSEQMAEQNSDIFEYFSNDISSRLKLVRQEKELSIFTQDVFLGKFRAMPDETIEEIMLATEAFTVNMIREGKKNGAIRTDMDDQILALFLIGASIKVKEHILKEAKRSGFDVTDERMEDFARTTGEVVELLKNGIGSKETQK